MRIFENLFKTIRVGSGPSLSWDALFSHSRVKLELLTDYDMHLFIEKGLRGYRW